MGRGVLHLKPLSGAFPFGGSSVPTPPQERCVLTNLQAPNLQAPNLQAPNLQAPLIEMVQNALRWTNLINLVNDMGYDEARAVVDHIFGPDSSERAELDDYFNIGG